MEFCPKCTLQRNAQEVIARLANAAAEGEKLERRTVGIMVRSLGGCPTSADKLFISGRAAEVGVYLLTLAFTHLKPSEKGRKT